MDALQKLGIDGWSLLLYLVNYGILFLVLGKFVYKPLAKIMDERSHTIQRNLAEAEQLKHDFQKEMDRRAKENDEFIKSMQLELMHTRTEAEARAKSLIAEAEMKREELITKAYGEVAAMKDRMVSDIERELLQKIGRIASVAMADAATEDAVSESVDRAWNTLRSRS
jgi:F-type H+-transporting ATPase subunit b